MSELASEPSAVSEPASEPSALIDVLRLSPEHAGELFTVQRAAYVSEAQRYNAHIPPLRETLDDVLADLHRPEVLAFGAWLGTRLGGSARGWPVGDRMEIGRIAVAPDMQGRGVGRTLLGTVEAARPAGVRTLWLGTGAASEDNLRLYRRSGYRDLERFTDDVGVEVLVLAKSVA